MTNNTIGQAQTTGANKTIAKIGLFGAISMIFSSVVGAGIFFKNGSVFANNGGNPWGVILSWVLTIVIALSTAYSFGEIVTCKTKSANSGLAGWAERYLGYNFGRMIKILYPLFYYTLYVLIMCTFLGEAFINCIPGGNDLHIGVVFAIGFAFMAFFLAMNLFAAKYVSPFANVAAILKYIPLVAVAVGGIVYGIINSDHNLFIYNGWTFNEHKVDDGKFDMTGVLASLPAILFAFDSFLVVGNIKGDIKNPQKNIPLSIVLSLVIASAFYMFITIGQIMTGCGSAFEVFEFMLGKDTIGGKIAHTFLSVFIMIALLGSVNGIGAAAVRSIQSSVEEEVIIGSRWVKKHGSWNPLGAGVIMFGFVLAVWVGIIVVPSIILNTDKLIDAVSTGVALIFFTIYGITIFGSFLNKFSKKVTEVIPQKGQKAAEVISFVGLFITLIFGMLVDFGFFNIARYDDALNWGLFHNEKLVILRWQGSLMFWGVVLIAAGIPFFNDWLIKITDRGYDQKFVWQKSNNIVGELNSDGRLV